MAYTNYTIPTTDPAHVKDLLELCSMFEWTFLQSDEVASVFKANNMSPATEPRACLAYANHVIITKDSFIANIEAMGEYPIANLVRQYISGYRTNGNPPTLDLIRSLQDYVGVGDNVIGNSLLAGLIASASDSESMLSLSASYLDRVVPKGAYYLIDYIKEDLIDGLLFSAMWLCDYIGFRAFYRQQCRKNGSYDPLSSVYYEDDDVSPPNLPSFLNSYAKEITDGDPEKIREDQVSAEKFIRGYQQYDASHGVSQDLRFAFLVLGFQYATELIYKSAALVTAEYFNSQIDQYMAGLSEEGARDFLDALLKMPLTLHAMGEALSMAMGNFGSPYDANWEKISKHVDALGGRPHPGDEKKEDTTLDSAPKPVQAIDEPSNISENPDEDFLKDYSELIYNNDQSLSSDDVKSEKFILTYKKFAANHSVSPRIRLAFLILGLQYKPELFYKNAGLVTAEFVKSELDKYKGSVDEETWGKVIGILSEYPVVFHAMQELFHAAAEGAGGSKGTNWEPIKDHIETLSGKTLSGKDEATSSHSEPQPVQHPTSSPSGGEKPVTKSPPSSPSSPKPNPTDSLPSGNKTPAKTPSSSRSNPERIVGIGYLVILVTYLLGLIGAGPRMFILFMMIEVGSRLAVCYIGKEQRSQLWKKGAYLPSLAINWFGIIGFVIGLIGGLKYEIFILAILLLAVREFLIYLLLRRKKV